MFFKRKSLGLALGGGAARGFAHLGVLKAFEEADIVPSYVAGTSVGSLIGSMYCAGMTWQEIWEASEGLDWSDFVKITMPHLGLVTPDKLEKLITQYTDNRSIEKLAIPFAAVAVDLATGTQVVFYSGPVGPAVRASCSIPGIFEPLELGDGLLADGGILNNLPGDVVRAMGASYVVSVDLVGTGAQPNQKPTNLPGVIFRSTQLLMTGTSVMGTAASDLVLVPKLDEFGFHEMSKRTEMLDAGYRAAQSSIDQILKKL